MSKPTDVGHWHNHVGNAFGKNLYLTENLTIDGTFAINGSMTFGDASADTLTVTGTATFSAATQFSNTITAGTQGSGLVTTTTNPFIIEIHAKPTSALTAGATGLSSCIRARYEVGAAQTNQISFSAIEGRLRPKYAMADGLHCGIQGGIEADAVAFTGTSTTQRCGGHFYLEMATGTTISSGFLTGVTIDSSVHGAVNVSSCTFAGLRIKTSSSKEIWTHGIYMGDNDAVTGITIGACTTGIATSGTFTAATGRATKLTGSVANANYGDGYAFTESELSITGTGAGHIAAFSSWINIGEGTHGAGGEFLAAQTNGIREATGATITDAKIIFGMRMTHQCVDTDAFGYFPFSVNASGNATTALFSVSAAATNLGKSGDGTDNIGSKVGVVPLYKEDGGTIGYVNVYSSNG